MPATTQAALVVAAKTAANAQVGGAWSSTEWNDATERAYEALWFDICGINSAFRLTTTTFTLSGGSQTQALPADFMEAYKVVKDPNTSNRITIERLPDEKIDGLQRTYRLEGNNLIIDPLELAGGNYQLRYCPTVTAMAGGSMDLELGQFREYVELASAIAYLDAEEADSSVLVKRFGIVSARVATWAARSRSAGQATPRDVRARWRGNRLYPY
jgi:hypothetical protein